MGKCLKCCLRTTLITSFINFVLGCIIYLYIPNSHIIQCISLLLDVSVIIDTWKAMYHINIKCQSFRFNQSDNIYKHRLSEISAKYFYLYLLQILVISILIRYE